MAFSVNLMRQMEQVDPPVRTVLYSMLEEVERFHRDQVTKADFNELKKVVQELAEAQKRTEQRVEELAEAQKRTEARLDSLTLKVEELAEAQKRTEARLDSLTLKVEALAEAQKRTEQRVEELAEAQKRTEARLDSLTLKVEALAEAQKRTEIEVAKLARSHQQLQKQVGGLSDAVGYGIEDRLMPDIPAFARHEFGVDLEDVERINVEYGNGKFDEVNLLGRLSGPGGSGFFVGECKARPGKKDADRFAAMLKRLSSVLEGKLYPVLIGYTFSPEVERYVAEKHPHLKLAKTYQIHQARRASH